MGMEASLPNIQRSQKLENKLSQLFQNAKEWDYARPPASCPAYKDTASHQSVLTEVKSGTSYTVGFPKRSEVTGQTAVPKLER